MMHVAAIYYPGSEHPVMLDVSSAEREVRKMVRRAIKKAPGEVLFCYEAGVCGFALARLINDEGARCMVIAPTLVPVRPGKKIKTDRRDAKNLGKLLRAGMLVEVHPPDEATEAVRDLVRCREAALADLQRTRQRLVKFLTRRAFVYRAGRAWTRKHLAWVDSVRFAEPATR
jgi:transposase